MVEKSKEILQIRRESLFCHTWGRFHETHHNLRLIVALTMYHSLMVLAMDSTSYYGLSMVSQDTINRSASWNRPQVWQHLGCIPKVLFELTKVKVSMKSLQKSTFGCCFLIWGFSASNWNGSDTTQKMRKLSYHWLENLNFAKLDWSPHFATPSQIL